jgi:cell envelope opacity-associated protein A
MPERTPAGMHNQFPTSPTTPDITACIDLALTVLMWHVQEVQAAEVKLATVEEQVGHAEAQAAALQQEHEQQRALQAEAVRQKEAAAQELQAAQQDLAHSVRKLEVSPCP